MALYSLLGSTALRRVLVHFAARPNSRLHFRALERRLGLSRQSMKNALDTLEELGLVRREAEGQRAFYVASDHPGWGAVRDVVRSFASPAEIVGDLLRGVPGVRAAFVFGSAASGRMRPDSDIDVMVVVDDAADARALGMFVLEAGMILGREIDLKCYAPSELRAERERPGTSYLKRVLAGPKEFAVGSFEDAVPA